NVSDPFSPASMALTPGAPSGDPFAPGIPGNVNDPFSPAGMAFTPSAPSDATTSGAPWPIPATPLPPRPDGTTAAAPIQFVDPQNAFNLNPLDTGAQPTGDNPGTPVIDDNQPTDIPSQPDGSIQDSTLIDNTAPADQTIQVAEADP